MRSAAGPAAINEAPASLAVAAGSAPSSFTPLDFAIDKVKGRFDAQPTFSLDSETIADPDAINHRPLIQPEKRPRQHPPTFSRQDFEVTLLRPFGNSDVVWNTPFEPASKPPNKSRDHKQLNENGQKHFHLPPNVRDEQPRHCLARAMRKHGS